MAIDIYIYIYIYIINLNTYINNYKKNIEIKRLIKMTQ